MEETTQSIENQTDPSNTPVGIGSAVLGQVELDNGYSANTAIRVSEAFVGAAWQAESAAKALNSSPEIRARGERITKAFKAVNPDDAEEFIIPRSVIQEIVDGGIAYTPTRIGAVGLKFLGDVLAATEPESVQPVAE
ncbi:MAG: hypothetical protein WCJ60_01930 [bacterium]